MGLKQATISGQSVARQNCCHYWVIESPASPTSRGVCKFCGRQKEFNNYLQDCLRLDKDRYEEWLRRQAYHRDEEKLEERVLSLPRRK